MNWDDLLGSFNNRTRQRIGFRNFPWSALISGGSGIIGSILQNVFNTRQIRETNQANRELVEMQNTFQQKEHEKAYQRSLPVQQVADMRNAGMSQAGAINALNGGGSYQPAPVNAAQDEAPQIDLTSAINAMQGAAQLAEQKRQFNMQHELAKQQHDLSKRVQDFEEQKWSDEANYRNNLNQKVLKEIDNLGVQKTLLDLQAELEQAVQPDKIVASKAKIARDYADDLLNKFKSDKMLQVMQRLDEDDLQRLLELQARVNMLQVALDYDAPAMAMRAWQGITGLVRTLFDIGL